MPNQNPEQIARDHIDKQLIACGWIIQGINDVNFHCGIGVAVKEYLTDAGPADAIGVTRSLKTDSRPLEKKPGAPLSPPDNQY